VQHRRDARCGPLHGDRRILVAVPRAMSPGSVADLPDRFLVGASRARSPDSVADLRGAEGGDQELVIT